MISVAIIAKNAERHIGDCLRSVAWADDIVVFDAGSEDRTLEIARAFTDRIFVTDWSGYGPQKNRAIEATRGDWVLSLDTDECVPPPLHREIVAALSDRSFVGFEIPRLNHIDGRPLRHGRAWPDYQMRLCRRGHGRFSSRPVHERLIVDGPTRRFVNPLHHSLIEEGEDFATKIELYGELGARALYQEGKRLLPGEGVTRGAWTFMRSYFLEAGFLDGHAGYRYAAYTACATLRKYRKLCGLTRSSAAVSAP
jgi:glycosyltransferase involved in cell wall biosynthesis